MATIGSVIVSLDVDIGRMSRFNDAARTVESGSARMRRGLGATTASVSGLRASMSAPMRTRMFSDSLRTITRTNDEIQRLRASIVALSAITGTGLTGALSGAYLLQTADRAKLLSNQLATVTSGSSDLANIQDRLYDISQRSRSGLESTARIYARTARASEFFAASQEDLLRVTETIQKAFSVGGATQAEAFGAAIQLSQGIASDRFSGEEFRSVAENAPVLLQNMAKQLGVNIGKLREMAHAGQLTGKVVVDAILKSSDAIDTLFDKTDITVGQSFTRLDNAFVQYIGEVDKSYGVSRQFSQAISGLANNLDEVGFYAANAAIAVGGIFAGRRVQSLVGDYQNFVAVQKNSLEIAKAQVTSIEGQRTAIQANIAARKMEYAAQVQASRAEGLSAKQRASAVVANQKSLAQINLMRREYLDLGKSLEKANVNLRTAEVGATRMGGALAIAKTAGAGLFSALGGYTGILIGAATIGMVKYAQHTAEAAAQTDAIVSKLERMGYLTGVAAGEMQTFQESLAEGRVSKVFVEIEGYTKLIKSTLEGLSDLSFDLPVPENLLDGSATGKFGALSDEFSVFSQKSKEIQNAFGNIIAEMKRTQEMSDLTRRAIEDLALANPEIASAALDLLNAGERLNAAAKATREGLDEIKKFRSAENQAPYSQDIAEYFDGLRKSYDEVRKITEARRAEVEETARRQGLSERETAILKEHLELVDLVKKSGQEITDDIDKRLKIQAEENVAIQEAATKQVEMLQAVRNIQNALSGTGDLEIANAFSGSLPVLDAYLQKINGLQTANKQIADSQSALAEASNFVFSTMLSGVDTSTAAYADLKGVIQSFVGDMSAFGVTAETVTPRLKQVEQALQAVGLKDSVIARIINVFAQLARTILGAKVELDRFNATPVASKSYSVPSASGGRRSVTVSGGSGMPASAGATGGYGYSSYTSSGIGLNAGDTYYPGLGVVRAYADGGIANEPSIFGEAGPEAAVPLPDGRTIPVTLSGAGTLREIEVNTSAMVDQLERAINYLSAIDSDIMAMIAEMQRSRTVSVSSGGGSSDLGTAASSSGSGFQGTAAGFGEGWGSVVPSTFSHIPGVAPYVTAYSQTGDADYETAKANWAKVTKGRWGISSARSFDVGGYTGMGGRLDPAGIVHKGEYVFSKPATDMLGVNFLDQMHKSAKGYAEGGYVGGSAGMKGGVGFGDIIINLASDADISTPAARRQKGRELAQEVMNNLARMNG